MIIEGTGPSARLAALPAVPDMPRLGYVLEAEHAIVGVLLLISLRIGPMGAHRRQSVELVCRTRLAGAFDPAGIA